MHKSPDRFWEEVCGTEEDPISCLFYRLDCLERHTEEEIIPEKKVKYFIYRLPEVKNFLHLQIISVIYSKTRFYCAIVNEIPTNRFVYSMSGGRWGSCFQLDVLCTVQLEFDHQTVSSLLSS